MTLGGEPRFPTSDRQKFAFEPREPRFTNEETNLELKEHIAQYADYVQAQIEAHLHLEKNHFGDEVRYGLCPRGGIGMFEKETTGGGAFYRLRGIYLEEEVIDERSQLGDELCALYPPILAHEICHDFEYTQDRYDEYYAPFKDTYAKDHFEYHLDELKIDKKSFDLLKGVHLDFPGHAEIEKAQSLFLGYLFWNNIELERFEGYANRDELADVVGENADERLTLKFARSIARIRYVLEQMHFENTGLKEKNAADVADYEQRVRKFLESRGAYDDAAFSKTTNAFLKFLRRES